jgi:hypothetical protein
MNMTACSWLPSLAVSILLIDLKRKYAYVWGRFAGRLREFCFPQYTEMYGFRDLIPCYQTNFVDPMQLVDELSMIYTACLMCYATFSFSRSRTVRRVLGTSLLSLAIFITVSREMAPPLHIYTNAKVALLSLPSRSNIPPECLRYYHSSCTFSIDVCHGSQSSSLIESQIRTTFPKVC